MDKLKVLNLHGVECYEKDGTAYLKLDTVARGLGFTQTQNKNGAEYTSIRWETIYRHLEDIGFPNKPGKDDFIPENIFYRLAMKAKNETAEKFQALVADEIIPSIRKTGGYIQTTPEMTDMEILAKAVLVAQATIKAREERIAALETQNQILSPKAEYFDRLVDRNLLTNFRDTAKELHIKQNEFIKFLEDNKFIYHDTKGNIKPYSVYCPELFEIKDQTSQKNKWAGSQTFITPKGKETFRLLLKARKNK